MTTGTVVISGLIESVRTRTDSALRSVLKNTGWVALSQVLAVAVAFAETGVLAHYLSLYDFGVFITITAAAELVFGLLDFRSSEAIIKFMPEIGATKGTTASSAFLKLILMLDAGVSTVGFAFIAILGGFVLRWMSLQHDYFMPLLIISFGLAARTAVASVGSYFRICGRFDQATKIGAITSFTRLGLIVVVAVFVPTIFALASVAAATNVLYMLVMSISLVFKLREKQIELRRCPIGLIADMRHSLTTFLLSGNLAGTTRMLSTKVDVLLMVALTTPAIGAIYKVSSRLAGSLMFFSDPLLVAIYPELSHLHANRHLVQLHKLLRTMTLALAIFAAVCVGGFAITGRWILSRFAGASYVAAYPVVLIMFAGSAASMVFFWARPLLLVRGHARTLVCIAIAASIAQVVGLYLLVPSMGAVGAGLAFALNYVVNIGLFLIVIVRSGRAQRIVPA